MWEYRQQFIYRYKEDPNDSVQNKRIYVLMHVISFCDLRIYEKVIYLGKMGTIIVRNDDKVNLLVEGESMIYIYNDFGGTHTTSLAAAYHLKQIPADHKLTKEEILTVPYFNQLKTSDMGKIIFHGIDEDGNSVYTVGRGSSKHMIPALKNLSSLLQEKYDGSEKIIFSNTSPTVPFAMTVGGLLSRRLHIDFLGVPLLVIGAKQCYQDIVRLVNHTKEMAKKTNKRVQVLRNKSFK